jgi:hypothetical protein
MKGSPRSHRAPAWLSDSTNQKLNKYALAASAAGVGLLAYAMPAEGKVVYTKTWTEITPTMKISLDLNHDGVADFSLSNHTSNTTGGGHFVNTLRVLASKNQVWGGSGYAFALPAGVRIGPGKPFRPQHSLMVAFNADCGSGGCTFVSGGPWINMTARYLGLKFFIKGKLHYGWARFNVTVTHIGIYAALTGYAYETVPNAPIVAGNTKGMHEPTGSSSADPAPLSTADIEPGSLGFLAQGARALDIWRKRDSAEAL